MYMIKSWVIIVLGKAGQLISLSYLLLIKKKWKQISCSVLVSSIQLPGTDYLYFININRFKPRPIIYWLNDVE